MLCFGLDFKFTNGFGLVIAKAIPDIGVAINVDRADIDARSGEIVIEVHEDMEDREKILGIVYDEFRRG